MTCCITVRLSDGRVKTYERHMDIISKYSGQERLFYAIRVVRISAAYMRKRLEIEGSHTKVLGGWIKA